MGEREIVAIEKGWGEQSSYFTTKNKKIHRIVPFFKIVGEANGEDEHRLFYKCLREDGEVILETDSSNITVYYE